MSDVVAAPEDAANPELAAPAHNPATISKSRLDEANSIITKYAAFGFGGGVIPFPMMDIAAVAGVQLKMLAELSKIYEVEFVENWGKTSLSALVGGAMPHMLAVGTVGSLIKAIPVVGSAVGFATVPLLAAASTYAVGKVFIQHFESGGTFLDFDAVAARTYFREQFAKGKELFQKQAAKLKNRRGKAEDVAVETETAPVEPAPVESEAAATSPLASEPAVAVEATGEEDVTRAAPLHVRRPVQQTTEG
ncbi:YcjF family protein [Azospirillum sp. sgz302134]